MNRRDLTRRQFGASVLAGVALGKHPAITDSSADQNVERASSAQPRSIRVAAIQMTADVADVDANMRRAQSLVEEAISRGAQWVVLPEFFTSGMAFHPDMAAATRRLDGAPGQLLLDLARKGNAAVGGSFLAWREGQAYNTFVLALPDGRTLRHDKDYPTFWENCYYVGGADDGVVSTPGVDVGVALCWEFTRTQTARRLKGRVSMVVGGSCWWTAPPTPANEAARRFNLQTLHDTPGLFARMLGVPVVHAAHAGAFEGRLWPGDAAVPYRSYCLGETQIVTAGGEVLARLSREDGEGVIVSDIVVGEPARASLPIPDSFWIPPWPEAIKNKWDVERRIGHEYYLANTLPILRRQFTDVARIAPARAERRELP